MATLRHHAAFVSRKAMVGSTLGLIGLGVGFGCALLPPAVPVGIVGLAALLLLWIMPDLERVPRAWTAAMLGPFLFATLCIPSFFGLILPGLPWISIRRAFLFAWIIPFCILLAGSSDSRAYIWGVLRRSYPILVCLFGFCCVMVLSTPVGISPATALNTNVNLVINSVLPMLAVVFVVRDERTFLKIFQLAIFCVAVDLVIGAIEFRLQRPFLIYVLPAWMRDQILTANPLAAATYITGLGVRGGLYRASSTYTTPLSWGEVSAMLVPMCVHFISYGKSLFQRCYGVLGMLMCFLSVVFSGSRGAYVGMIAATITYSIVWSFRAVRKNPGSLAGGIWLALYAMGSSAVLLAVTFVGRVHRLVLGGGEAQSSTDSRAAEWALAKPKILARPILGYGAGSAGDVIHYIVPGGFVTVDGFHMNLLVDYGIPGFIFFFGIFLCAAYSCLRTYITTDSQQGAVGAAIGAGILAFILYRFTLSQVDSLPIAFMMVGLTVAYSEITAQPSAAQRSIDPTRRMAMVRITAA